MPELGEVERDPEKLRRSWILEAGHGKRLKYRKVQTAAIVVEMACQYSINSTKFSIANTKLSIANAQAGRRLGYRRSHRMVLELSAKFVGQWNGFCFGCSRACCGAAAVGLWLSRFAHRATAALAAPWRSRACCVALAAGLLRVYLLSGLGTAVWAVIFRLLFRPFFDRPSAGSPAGLCPQRVAFSHVLVAAAPTRLHQEERGNQRFSWRSPFR